MRALTTLGKTLFELDGRTNPSGTWHLNKRVEATSYWGKDVIKDVAVSLIAAKRERSITQLYFEDAVQDASTWRTKLLSATRTAKDDHQSRGKLRAICQTVGNWTIKDTDQLGGLTRQTRYGLARMAKIDMSYLDTVLAAHQLTAEE